MIRTCSSSRNCELPVEVTGGLREESWGFLSTLWTFGDQTNKKRGPIQSVFEGGGQGLRPIEPALRHRVPLPCSSSDPCELDPGEQCEWGWGGRREAGGWIICLGNKAAFLSDNNWQARFHFPALLWRAALFLLLLWWFQERVSWKGSERTFCCTGVSFRTFSLLLLFLLSTKAADPG